MRITDRVILLMFGALELNAVSSSQTDPLSNITKLSSKSSIKRANDACNEGEWIECFKSSAIFNLDWFLSSDSYTLSKHAKIVKMSPRNRWSSTRPDKHQWSSAGPDKNQWSSIEPDKHQWSSAEMDSESSEAGSETSSSSRSSTTGSRPTWGHFVESFLRRVGAFVEASMIEVNLTDELTENGRYEPRFMDEITSEIDALEDKNDNIFSRTKMKKLLIPLLLVLKVFKLKLLLFLPLILGLASFKKFIGFLIIALPAVIGFLKFCKPDLSHSYGSSGHSSYYNRPPHRRYQLASRVDLYTRGSPRPGPGSLHAPPHAAYPPPSRLSDQFRDKDAYHFVGTTSHQTYTYPPYSPFTDDDHHQDRIAHQDAIDDGHQLAYNGYQEYVNK